ncbi:MAG: hypothetical protein PW843_24310 [Azospirillaceae bacterium]|nr:hypothetical protein [Azospirillaceae bacterium]
MSDQRTCPIEGCPVHIDGTHLMCRAHWLQVPGWLRRKITKAWRDYRAIRLSTDHVEVLAAIRTHRVVADEAVAFINARPAAAPAEAEDAPPEHLRWPGPGPAPASWWAADGTKVYRDYDAYCD